MVKKRKSTKKVAKSKPKASFESEIKTYERNLGHLAFIAGVIVAVIAGISTDILEPQVVTIVLVVLGLIVGFMNITTDETHQFLVAAIVLMVAGVANVLEIPGVGRFLQTILENIAKFVAPAAVVVALKTVKKLAETV